jgi:hypothetical protein
MCELFCYVARRPDFPLELEASILNGIEVIWVLKKSSPYGERDHKESIGGAFSAGMHTGAAGDERYQEKGLSAACPLCCSDNVHRARPDTVEPRPVFACDDCGFVFVLPRAEQDFSGLPEQA